MKDNFADRVLRLDNLTKGLEVSKSFPLLREIKIPKHFFNMLCNIIQIYLDASLVVSGQKKSYHNSRFHNTFWKEILHLPNITPNGAFLPQKETALEFSLLHKCLGLIFKSFGIDDKVDYIQTSSFLRIIDGKNSSKADSRPYSTTKIHTDIWNGGPARTISLIIPLMGDINNTSIEFFGPKEQAIKNFMKQLADYKDGEDIAFNSEKYNFKWRIGYFYFFDIVLMHRTLKKGGGPRASIDFRFIPKEEVESDSWGKEVDANDKWIRHNFRRLKEWYEIGENFVIMPLYSFAETIRRKQEIGDNFFSGINHADLLKVVKIH